MKKALTISLIALVLFTTYCIINAFRIYLYSTTNTLQKADVAVVLGAGTHHGQLSPVYRERVNHALFLYKDGWVNKIIFTGGLGEGETQSDSKTALQYALANGLPEEDLLLEETSRYTFENLENAKSIMAQNHLHTAAIVSDPMHLKRALMLAHLYGIHGYPSPTSTSMYRSKWVKFKQLMYETFYFSLREPMTLLYKQ